ncbi:hypothetical protein Tasa_009_245 [Tanticharoenia sakaeratensis NBRC 103193]|uniref:Uncharacterized protein n=1 Tax=Tanticharoenia sakaeratensis NBRC 103193 TaxID=1231623 RepID=A0A0D6MJ17_9PROT|nr:hypothetical protein Tasa_009_245 [Tanticharoenia sakaeratensis NBRC 103193]
MCQRLRILSIRIGRGHVRQADPAGHAEMPEHGLAARYAHEDVFPAPCESLDPATGQDAWQGRRDRPAQVGPSQQDMGDLLAFETGTHGAHDGFDFGELWHRSA